MFPSEAAAADVSRSLSLPVCCCPQPLGVFGEEGRTSARRRVGRRARTEGPTSRHAATGRGKPPAWPAKKRRHLRI